MYYIYGTVVLILKKNNHKVENSQFRGNPPILFCFFVAVNSKCKNH